MADGSGIKGRVWFLPYLGAAAADTPETLAAMKLMPRRPYTKAEWKPADPPPDEPECDTPITVGG